MRKHYVPAILGFLFMAALIVLQSNKQCEAPAASINYPKKITVKIELDDRLASTINNAVSFLIQTALYRLA